MPRLTITLTTERHRALKEAAARSGRTIGELIEQSLDLAGIKTQDTALAILRRAQQSSGMSETAAISLAVKETRAARRGK